LLQVKVEQTDKQLQEMQDSKSKGQKTKQKHQVSTSLGISKLTKSWYFVRACLLRVCCVCSTAFQQASDGLH